MGHVLAAPFLVVGEWQEKRCEEHLPRGTEIPPNSPHQFACEDLPDGGARMVLLGSDCTDIPQPPPHGSWRCTLDGGESWWDQE